MDLVRSATPAFRPRRSVRSTWSIASVLAVVMAAAHAGTPPAGFVETDVLAGDAATGAARATAAAYEPGSGNLWVTEKGPGSSLASARVRLRDASSGNVSTALTLDCVDSRGERGILGIAFSPDYLAGPSSRLVYLYYTRAIAAAGPCSIAGQPESSRNRVSRFLENGGILSGEEVIYETPALTARTNHNGGAIRFAPDGTLFVAIGDNDTDADANPLSRDLSDPRGKLLRLEPGGGAPADNPFVGQAGVLPEIWAWGLRNPFRFAIDPTTGDPYIGDVGEALWEAIYAGVPGADYGYPCVEADQPFRTCNPAPAPGSVVDPIYVYHHGTQTPPVSGRSVTGGPVYRHTAFPADYRGSYFFGDFVAGWIRRGRPGPGPTLEDVQMFIPDAGSVVDLVVSPAGCLTYVVFDGPVREVCFADATADGDGDGFSIGDGDCDDGDPATYPGAPDLCDGRDNSCSGAADDARCDRFEVTGDLDVDGHELAWLGRAFGDCSNDPPNAWWFGIDYTLDGCVDGDDLSVLMAVWGCDGAAPICP